MGLKTAGDYGRDSVRQGRKSLSRNPGSPGCKHNFGGGSWIRECRSLLVDNVLTQDGFFRGKDKSCGSDWRVFSLQENNRVTSHSARGLLNR